MKYKIGEKVRIKSLDWYEANKDGNGENLCGCEYFTEYMQKYCGKVMTISSVNKISDTTMIYFMIEDEETDAFTEEMICGSITPKFNINDTVETYDGLHGYIDEIKYDGAKEKFEYYVSFIVDGGYYYEHQLKPYIKEEKKEEVLTRSKSVVVDYHSLPEGCVFRDEKGNIINSSLIVVEKKETWYPKDLVECLGSSGISMKDYKEDILHSLKKLLICRDAYWKLADNYTPDWLNDDVKKWCISHGKKFSCFGGLGYLPYPLTFPTEEMMEAFYNAFKKDIEICSELI